MLLKFTHFSWCKNQILLFIYLQAITDTELLSDAFFEFDHFFVHNVTNLVPLIKTQEVSQLLKA